MPRKPCKGVVSEHPIIGTITVKLKDDGIVARLAAEATTIINAEDYGRIINDLAVRRDLIVIGGDIVGVYGGGERAVADRGSGPTTHGNESETDHGKGHWGSRPMLTRIGAGKGSRYIDGSTLGGIQVGRQRWEIWEVGVAAVGIGPPARRPPPGCLWDGGQGLRH